MSFARNVFINCPFDKAYDDLLRPLLFTILAMKMTPQIALMSNDGGSPRIEKLFRLIRRSKFGIHDLSRLKAKKKDEYFRLNMPFELGLDVGSRQFGRRPLTAKRYLILEAEKYRYQAALSDISGSDIRVHGDSPEQVLAQVRGWLHEQTRIRIRGPSALWGAFNACMAAIQIKLLKEGHSLRDIESISTFELVCRIRQWIKTNAAALR